MQLEILGLELLDDTHTALFMATLQRLAHHENVESASLYLRPREASGWLEYGLSITYVGGTGLYLGCIQRTTTSTPEFHS